MLNSRKNYARELHDSAHLYRNLGWSVIPIWGDMQPARPKAAAINWAEFQHRLPGHDELDDWFSEERYGGLALVCGSISGIAVLDFDREDMAEAFARCCPELTQTFTVRSGGRGLPHYYYRVPAHFGIHNKRVNGADLQASAVYVVAPPTMIAGKRWEVSHDFDLLTLSLHTVNRIRSFMDTYQVVESGAVEKNIPHTVPFIGMNDPGSQKAGIKPTVAPEIAAPVISHQAIRGWYHNLAAAIGRNNALLRIAICLRDDGWERGNVIDILIDMHVLQPPGNPHYVETPQQRRREAEKTIRSAFKRPPRPKKPYAPNHGLPNSLREYFLQSGQVSTARVLDGLLLSGLLSGNLLTERVICTLLRGYGIGRRAVQDALKTLTPDGIPVFTAVERAVPPLNPPQIQNAHAANKTWNKQKKCSFVRRAKRVKSSVPVGVGCPARWYVMPDIGRLCRILGVQRTPGDPIQSGDLKSPKTYRHALQRALIQRRPGLYSRKWLCERIGISVWTCRRYDREIGLLVKPIFYETGVTWDNVTHLPEHRLSPNGTFLVRPDGKRFPPVRGIAIRMLRFFRAITLKRQGWNFYRFGSQTPLEKPISYQATNSPLCENNHNKVIVPQAPSEEATCQIALADNLLIAPNHAASITPVPEITVPITQDSFWVCSNCLKTTFSPTTPGSCKRCHQTHWEFVPESIWRNAEQCKAWWSKLWRDKRRSQKQPEVRLANPRKPERLPDLTSRQAAVADRLYEMVKWVNPERALTRRMASSLVAKYDVKLVEWVLERLSQNRGILNPAGFVIVVLRSEYKFGSHG